MKTPNRIGRKATWCWQAGASTCRFSSSTSTRQCDPAAGLGELDPRRPGRRQKRCRLSARRDCAAVPGRYRCSGEGQHCMDIIGSQKIWTFAGGDAIADLTSSAIRKKPAHRVRNYMDLATKVAELQFRNRDFVLMFRGQ